MTIDPTLQALLLIGVGALIAWFLARREKKDDQQSDLAIALSQVAQRISHLERDNIAHAEQAKTLITLERGLGELRVEVKEVRNHISERIESICQDFKRLTDTMMRTTASGMQANLRADFMAELRALTDRYANG